MTARRIDLARLCLFVAWHVLPDLSIVVKSLFILPRVFADRATTGAWSRKK